MNVSFKNATTDAKAAKDCEILSISIEKSSLYTFSKDFSLTNGVTFGMTIDEVVNLMGEQPTDSYDGSSGYATRTYAVSSDIYANNIKFDFSDGKLNEIKIENYDK